MLTVALACAIFIGSTIAFDVIHFLLHRWSDSSFRLLKFFAGLHEAHHKFLDRNMQINEEFKGENLLWHVWPEYLTSVAFMAPMFLILPWLPVAVALAARVTLMMLVLRVEGEDINHMPKQRVKGRRSIFVPTADYHAVHHIYPKSSYGSFSTFIDLILGTVTPLAGRRVLLTGSSGAYGSEMKETLERMGAIVETAKSGLDFRADYYEPMIAKLERADILVLAHGTKYDDCWNANYVTFVNLIDHFQEIGRGRLVPPEVWACGSEIDVFSDFPVEKFRAYVQSKHAFAKRASDYYRSDDLTYRHIVISSFTSRMGPGLISARTAVWASVFLIARGFRYIPITYTALAFWAYVPFRLRKSAPSTHASETRTAA